MLTALYRMSMAIPLAIPFVAAGQTSTWIGPPTGSWSVGSNWSGNVPPATFAAVRIDGGAAQNSAVTLDVPVSINSLEIGLGDSLLVNNGIVLSIGPNFLDGLISGPGTLRLGDGSAAQIVAAGPLTFSGGGTVDLGAFGIVRTNTRLLLSDYNMLGIGDVSGLQYTVGSTGFLQSRAPAGATGVLATLFLSGADGVFNNGTISATGGTTLSIATNRLVATGTLRAADGGTVILTQDTTVSGGTLTTQGSGVILAAPSAGNNRVTLSNVALTGTFRSQRADTRITDTFFNAGTFLLEAGGAPLRLGSGTTQFTGGGAMRLTGFGVLGDGTATLLNTNHTLRGFTPSTGVSVGTIINAGGLIEADTPGQSLTLAPAVVLYNSGTLLAGNGSELRLGGAGSVDNRFGRIVARGAGSRVLLDQSTRILGGTIEGDGVGEVLFDAPDGTLTLDNVVNLGRVRLNSGTLMGGDGGLIINSGTIVTSGLISIREPITLLGTGQFVANSTISGFGIVNHANRVSGAGEVERLENGVLGIVEAVGTRLSLLGPTTNTGVMRAVNGGTLIVAGTNNAGGRIEAGNGSGVEIRGSVSTGTIAALSGGAVHVLSPLGAGVTLVGPGSFNSIGGAGTLATLTNGGTILIGGSPVLSDASIRVVGSATLNFLGPNSLTLKDVSLNAGAATLSVGAGSVGLQGTLTNRINLHLRGNSTDLSAIVPSGTVMVTGGGTIYGAGGTLGGGRLINLDNTIHIDAPFFGQWAGGWENYGTFSGTGALSFLKVGAASTTPINRGVITGGNQALLQVFSTTITVLDNVGGVIRGGDGGTVTLSGLTIRGGTLDGTRGTINGAATLEDLVIYGTGVQASNGRLSTNSYVTLADGAMLSIGDPIAASGELGGFGTFVGSGTIRLLPRGTVTRSLNLDGVTLFGGGTIDANSVDLSNGGAIIARPLAGFAESNSMTFGASSVRLPGARVEVEAGSTLNVVHRATLTSIDLSGGSLSVRAGGVLNFRARLENGRVINDGIMSVTGANTVFVPQFIEGSGTIIVGTFVACERLAQSAAQVLDGAQLQFEQDEASRLQYLAIAPTGRLNINRAALVLDYEELSPLDLVREQTTKGYAGGSWNGGGINSFYATIASRRSAVGYAEASDIGLAYTVFLGQQVDASAVLLRYTLQGDANLDAAVDLNDFARLAGNFNRSAVWSRGDFNYDGVADITDFGLLASNFNRPLSGDAGRAVPEPAAGLALIALVSAVRRGRTSAASSLRCLETK